MHLSGGHAVEMAADGLQALTAPKVVYAGWPIPQDWAVECFCLESPKLTLQALGTHPGDSLPLRVMPLDRSYEVETEVEAQGQATAGLLLFSPQVCIGLSISAEGIVRRVQEAFQRDGGTEEPRLGRSRVAIRIVNDKQDVRFYYRDDAGSWRRNRRLNGPADFFLSGRE